MNDTDLNQVPRVLNVDCYFIPFDGYAYEKACFEPLGIELILQKAETEDEIIGLAPGARVILTEGLATPMTRRVIETLDDCWAIGRYGIGVDSIDLEAATDHGIIVFNTADYCVEEVSDHAAALLLAAARRVVRLDRHVQNGGWSLPDSKDWGLRRLSQLTLGLVAFGNIARCLARKMSGFGMTILAYDPYISSEAAAESGVELVPLERLLKESDLISVHTPLNAETRHLIGEAELRQMKPSALLVNTSRGGVIDPDVLIHALKEGWIAGAALDVTEPEPPPEDSPLRGIENLILTPHQAASSAESWKDVRTSVVDAVSSLVQGHWPAFPVNPKVEPKVSLKPYEAKSDPSHS